MLPAPVQAVSQEHLRVTQKRPCLQTLQKSPATWTDLAQSKECSLTVESITCDLLPAQSGSTAG